MPVDFVKIAVGRMRREELAALKDLDFQGKYSISSGDYLEDEYVAKHHGCDIIAKRSENTDWFYVTFLGSLHKLWNSLNGIKAPNYYSTGKDGFNGNQFTLPDYLYTRLYLERILQRPCEEMIIHNLEIGCNVLVNFLPTLFLNGLLYFQGQPFQFNGTGHYAQAELQRYRMKIYDKGHQYSMDGDVLRIELKFNRMEDLKHLGINSVASLNATRLRKAIEMVVRRFQEVVYYDYTIKRDSLTDSESRKADLFANQRYWIVLEPHRRHRPKKELQRLIDLKSDNLKASIVDQILLQVSALFNKDQNPECVIINRSNIELTITPKTIGKKCVVTGLDISMQKEESLLISHTGLRHYHHKDKVIFDMLFRKFLGQNGQTLRLRYRFENLHTISVMLILHFKSSKGSCIIQIKTYCLAYRRNSQNLK